MKINHKRFWEAHRADRQKMKFYRDKMHEAVERLVGKHAYPKSKVSNPVNMIELAVNIYARILMPNRPRFMVTGKHQGTEGSAELYEMALNHFVKEIDMETAMKRCVKNSLFQMGVAKVGLNQSKTVEIGGILHDVGQPYCNDIDFGDLAFDMEAKKIEQMQYVGDRFTIPYNAAVESGLYDREVLRKHKPYKDYHSQTNLEGDEKLEAMSRDNIGADSQYMKMVELWEIYFPFEGRVITYSDELMSNGNYIPLREIDYYGPESGPYESLFLDEVPEQLMPLPPVAIWRDMADLISSMYKKMANQSRNTKNIGIGQKGDDKDIEKVKNAKDGDFVPLVNAQNATTMTLGGIDQTLFAFVLSLMDVYSSNAGNLRQLGGLAAEAETLGQETMLARNSSTRINEMLMRVNRFIRRNGEKIAWYLKNDQLFSTSVMVDHPVAGQVPINITQEDLEDEFFEYNYDIDPYSQVDMNPSRLVQSLTFYLQNILAPLIPFSVDMGGPINLQYLNHVMARMLNIPDIERIVTFGGESTMRKTVNPESQRQSPNTTRTNVRVNKSTKTPEGQSSMMQQELMSAAKSGNGMDMNKLQTMMKG